MCLRGSYYKYLDAMKNMYLIFVLLLKAHIHNILDTLRPTHNIDNSRIGQGPRSCKTNKDHTDPSLDY